jgi:hypothetical protein
MNTLVDFITQNKGIEYLLAIAFIGGYALFVEFLKPRPFRGLVSSIRDDMGYMKGEGKADMKRLMKNMLVLPFVAGAYMAALPFYMLVGMTLKAERALSGIVGSNSMAWRPLEAYLSGRAKKRTSKKTLGPAAQSKEEGK